MTELPEGPIQFSEHFASTEFEKTGPIPLECVPIFTRLCVDILEPARAYANAPFSVTSGYRPPEANAAAHGQPNSEHMATEHWCACDFYPAVGATGELAGLTARLMFDWMRNNASLPFHQLILEHGQDGSSVIHVSINDQKPGVRSVLEGATHNAAPYTKVDYVAYNPATVPPGVDESTQV